MADDIVTLLTAEEDPSTKVQSITLSSMSNNVPNNMTNDKHISDVAWSHNPETSHLFWVSFNGSSPYMCSPGMVECEVVVHYCSKKGC